MRIVQALAAFAAAFWPAAAAAEAQDAPAVISPINVESDNNGVNLATGMITIDGPALSVPAAPNLRFDRVQNAAPYVTGRSAAAEPARRPPISTFIPAPRHPNRFTARSLIAKR